MTVTSPQTFGHDYILPKLVAHFNSQPASARTIKSNDLPLYKIKVISDGAGQPTIIIGDQSSSFPSSKYLGEATFIWTGPRDTPVTATAAHFFELSKFINVQQSGGTGSTTTFITKEATYIGDTVFPPEQFPALPLVGDYYYTLRIEADDDVGWGGSILELRIGNSIYSITLVGPGGHDLKFAARLNDAIELHFFHESTNPAYVNLAQHDSDFTSPTVVLWPETGSSYPELVTVSDMIRFNAPFVAFEPDMILNTNTTLINEPDYGAYGGSISMNTDHSRIAIRSSVGDGTTFLYNNTNLGGDPELDPITSVYGGYDHYQSISRDGIYLAVPSTGWAIKILRDNGTTYVDDTSNVSAVGGAISWAEVQTAVTGTPVYVGANDRTKKIMVFERDASGWAIAQQISPPGTSYQFARRLALNENADVIVTFDGDNRLHMFKLNGNDWTTGSVDYVDLSDLLSDGESTMHIEAVSLNNHGSLAVSYTAELNEVYTNKLSAWANVVSDGAAALRIIEVTSPTIFTGLTNCDSAETTLTDKGFMAATVVGTSNAGIWISQDANNSSGQWGHPVSDPLNMVTFPLPSTVDVSGSRYNSVRFLAPLAIGPYSMEMLIGCALEQSVIHQGFYK